MKIDFKVEDAVRRRYSVRTYDGRPLEDADRQKILACADSLNNPLGSKIKIQIIDKETDSGGEKLGTYGIIKGAKTYLAVIIPNEEYAPEALGYDFEQLVLYAASLGLGTCWLGGTFDRSAFASRVKLEENEIFAILSPVGYPAQKMRTFEKMMRRTVKANDRMPWTELFFRDGFASPLTPEEAGDYRFPLEMLRLAPSAVNRQPWRVVMTEGAFHFFEKTAPGSEAAGVDLHRIDVGIGVCHFHLAAVESGLEGHFERNCPDITVPEGMDYIASWVM